MDRPDLYDSDILAWSEQQAAALRRLAGRRELPNELDLDNVVEEIETVGRNDAFSPSMQQRIEMDALWERALKQAGIAIKAHGGSLSEDLQGPCPIELDTLLSSDFDLPEIVRRTTKSRD
jgi:hypothetical protein